MATQRPRIAVTLNAETIAALHDLADAMGRPSATVASELLAEMAPQMHDLAKMVRLTKAGKATAAKRVLHHMIGDAAAELMTQTQPDMFKRRAIK
jgi:hypothetical protein